MDRSCSRLGVAPAQQQALASVPVVAGKSPSSLQILTPGPGECDPIIKMGIHRYDSVKDIKMISS